MKNSLFRKQVTTLVMGSLMIFSGQALAISSNRKQELINAEAWGESELIIAQTLTAKEKNDLAEAVESGIACFGLAIAAAEASAIPDSAKDAIAQAFSTAQTTVGPALSSAVATAETKGDADAIAKALSSAKTAVGPAISQSKAFADSPLGDALAKEASNAESCLDSALAKIEAIAN